MSLQIKSVEITNIKGIEHLKFEVGTLTVIRGANGTGKSSVLDAISAVFEGGHSPDLISSGKDRGFVLITLTNGTTILKTITEKRSTVDIITADGLKVPKPAAFLERLATGFSFDPIAFLNADPKKRAQFLLEAMPIVFARDEVGKITGNPPSKDLDMDGFAQLRTAIYDKRRDANVLQRDIGATVQNLQQALPADDKEDWPGKVRELQQRVANLKAELSTAVDAVQSQQWQLTNEKKSIRDAALAAADTTLRDAVRAAEKAYADAEKAARSEYDAAIKEINAAAADAEKKQTAEINAEVVTASSELATAEERAQAQRKADGIRSQIADYSKRLEGKLMESLQLDAQLKALDELKMAKLSESAIPGVEVVDGQVFVDGLNFDTQVNRARQITTAFQVVALAAGELGFMVCDNAESLVGTTWEEFCEAARGSGFQVLASRAEPGQPLTVEGQKGQ